MNNELIYDEMAKLEECLKQNAFELLEEYVAEELFKYSNFILEDVSFDKEEFIKVLEISKILEKMSNSDIEYVVSVFVTKKTTSE